MSNLGLWGKNPCVSTLSCFPPSLVSPNRFDVLMENGCWWLGQLLSLGVGWQDCLPFSHTPTPPTTFHTLHSIPVSSPSRPHLLRLTGSSGRFTLTPGELFALAQVVGLVFSFTVVICGSSLSHRECSLAHAPPIHVLSVGCSPSRRRRILAHSRAQGFPGFTHVVFLCGPADGSAVSFPHGLIRGVYIVVAHARIGRL